MSASRIFAFCCSLVLHCPALAQDWPTSRSSSSRRIRPAARRSARALLGAKVGESLKQQFIVENRTGASGIIGTDYVAKSAPDGYTFVFIFDTHSVHQASTRSFVRSR
jgi:hypothetical protein